MSVGDAGGVSEMLASEVFGNIFSVPSLPLVVSLDTHMWGSAS